MNPDCLIIAAQPKPKISVELVGVKYVVTPPKAAFAMTVAAQAQKAGEDPDKIMKALTTWVHQAFGKAEGPKILARLKDPDDLLDINHLMELLEKLTEKVTGVPPT